MPNDFADFLENAGLYDTIEITEANVHQLYDLLAGKIKISVYCKQCKEKRVFTMNAIKAYYQPDDEGKASVFDLSVALDKKYKSMMICQIPMPGKTLSPSPFKFEWSFPGYNAFTRLLVFPFVCAMDSSHHFDIVVLTDNNTMFKIGQYPSLADITFPEITEFEKIIDRETRKELGRAIGLFAQGIGVGSYVYLRRIFERILEMAKKEAEQETDPNKKMDLSNYNELRINERITLLKNYLPDMIVSNATIYGIISKGIHELSEEDCIEYFPIMKDSIFIILQQWAQKRRQMEEQKRLTEAIAKVHQKLK